MTAPRTIAVGFDLSPDAWRAAHWAADLAAATGARVVLVHARGLLERYEHLAPDVALEDAVTTLVAEHALRPGALSARLVEGDALSALLACASAPVDADLLVVGTRGAGQHSGRLLGSTSLQLAERSVLPVVIVPASWAAPRQANADE